MAFAENGAIRIYYEVEGQGDAVVLMHGFSDSAETWREYGYVEGLAREYQVVLIDARGHGRSDKPHESGQYRLETLVRDITSVLDDIGVAQTHFYGISMGGRYAYGMAAHAPERLRSLMIGAVSPWRNPDRTEAFVSFLRQGPEAFIPVWESQAAISDALKARMAANDPDALIAMVLSRTDTYEVAGDSVSRLRCPYRVIVGDQDGVAPYDEVVRYAAQLGPECLITLPGLNHLESMQRTDVVLPHLVELLESAAEHTAR